MAFGQYLGIIGTVVGAAIGAVVGTYVYPGVGAAAGAQWGAVIGGAAGGIASTQFPEKPDVKSTPPPQARENRVQVSSYGAMIPEIDGAKRIAGNIVCVGPTVKTERQSKHRQAGVRYHENEIVYTKTLIIVLCKGPVTGISRVWSDNEIFLDFRDPDGAYFPPGQGELAKANQDASSELADQYVRFYYGSESQAVDPTHEAIVGAGLATAFRGWCYIVLPDFPIGKFGALPNIEAEVVKSAVNPSSNTVFVATDAAQLNARGTHEFTRDGNFVGVSVATGSGLDLGGGAKNSATVTEYNRFSNQALRSAPLVTPEHSTLDGIEYYPPPTSRVGRYFSSWAVCPHSGELWVGWTIVYANGGSSTGQEMVFQIYSSPGGPMVRQWSEYSASWAGLYSPKFHFVGDYVWMSFGVYSGGYYSHFQKRVIANQEVLKSFTRIHVQATPGGTTRDYDLNVYGTDGECFYGWVDLPPYGPVKFKPDDVIITGGVGYLYEGVNFVYLENRYNGDYPVSWAGWYPPAASSVVSYGFNVFEKKYFLPQIHTLNLYVKDPDHADAFVDSSSDTDGVRKRSTVGEQPASLSDVFSRYCLAAGLDASEIDAAALSSDQVVGYGVMRQTPARTILEPLTLPYQFDVAEIDWKLKAVKRGGASVVTIPDADLGAVPYGSAAIARVSETREQNLEIPTHLTFTYEDINRDYDIAAQNAVRVDRPHYFPATLSTPLVMNATLAKRTVEIALRIYYMSRCAYKFATGPKYIEYAPTDVVTVAGKEMRITSMAWRGGVVQFSALAEAGGAYTSAATAQGIGYALTNVNRYSYVPLYVLMELPALGSLDNTAGLYAAMFGISSSYQGGTIQRSVDGGSTFSDVGTFNAPSAVVYYLQSVLGSGFAGALDYASSVIVNLSASSGTLSSATDEQLANGANLVAIGAGNSWELLQFKTATLSSGVYTLTGLLRGLYGTDRFISTHGQGENLVKLNGQVGIKFISSEASAIGTEYLYRVLNPAGITGDTFAFTVQGVSLEPLAPAAVIGTRNAAGDLLISWKRSDRFKYTVPDLQDYTESEPSSEAALDFEVDILHPVLGTVVRTLASGASEFATYTAAQITADAYPKRVMDEAFSDPALPATLTYNAYADTISIDAGRMKMAHAHTDGGGSNAIVNQVFSRSGKLFINCEASYHGYVQADWATDPWGPNDIAVIICKSAPAFNATWSRQNHPEISVGNNSCLSVHFGKHGTTLQNGFMAWSRVSGSNTKLGSIFTGLGAWITNQSIAFSVVVDFDNHTVSVIRNGATVMSALAWSSSLDAQLGSNVSVVFHSNVYSAYGQSCWWDNLQVFTSASAPFPVTVDIYQKSAVVGRGLPARAYV